MKTPKRAATANTTRVTVSLRPRDLAVMTRLAKRRHRGNLSGAFAEVIAHAARLEAMDQLLEELPSPSPEGLARLAAELATPAARPRPGARRKPTAA